MQLNQLSAVEIARLTRSGEISVEQVVGDCLAHIAAREPVVKAWAVFDAEDALRQARDLDRNNNGVKGPLHGVPVGVKDVIDTFDMRTEMGSPIYAGHQPRADAACVATSFTTAAAAPSCALRQYVHFARSVTSPNPDLRSLAPRNSYVCRRKNCIPICASTSFVIPVDKIVVARPNALNLFGPESSRLNASEIASIRTRNFPGAMVSGVSVTWAVRRTARVANSKTSEAIFIR